MAGPYKGLWHGIKTATTFKGRHGTSSPRLGEDPPVTHTLRAGKRWRAPRGTPLGRCVRRSLPGLLIFAFAAPLLWFGEHSTGWNARDSFIATAGAPVAAALSLAFAYAAATAQDPRRWRAPAVVANLLFPAFLVAWYVLG
jgi:hypothetical protein